ncbi:MAG: dienelactone hydrolase family protein [Pseudomonadota bacterium]
MQTQHIAPSPLTSSSLTPSGGGPAKNLVILLHGFGANGGDLLSLGKSWQSLLPETEFTAPNAPEPCAASSFDHSYQWFDLKNLQLTTLQEGVAQALPVLNTYIDQELNKRNLTDSQLMLVGFSQGTMMALAASLSRPKACAGVLGYSGALFYPPNLPIHCKPPIFLIHGDADEVIEVEYAMRTAAELSELGVPVKSFVAKEIGHHIDAQGQQLGGQFICNQLNWTTNKEETKR